MHDCSDDGHERSRLRLVHRPTEREGDVARAVAVVTEHARLARSMQRSCLYTGDFAAELVDGARSHRVATGDDECERNHGVARHQNSAST